MYVNLNKSKEKIHIKSFKAMAHVEITTTRYHRIGNANEFIPENRYFKIKTNNLPIIFPIKLSM